MKLENCALNDGQDWMLDGAMFGYAPIADVRQSTPMPPASAADASLMSAAAAPTAQSLNLAGPLAITIAVLTVIGFVVLDFNPKFVLPLGNQSSHPVDLLPTATANANANAQLSSTHLPSIAGD